MPLDPLESAHARLLAHRVRQIGGIIMPLVPITKGAPDRLVMLPMGRIFLVELKTTRGALSPAQKVWHERAHAIGVSPVVLVGAEAILEWIRSVADEQSDVEPYVPCARCGRPIGNRHYVIHEVCPSVPQMKNLELES